MIIIPSSVNLSVCSSVSLMLAPNLRTGVAGHLDWVRSVTSYATLRSKGQMSKVTRSPCRCSILARKFPVTHVIRRDVRGSRD